jgi:hypothetical protein
LKLICLLWEKFLEALLPSPHCWTFSLSDAHVYARTSRILSAYESKE